MVLRFQSLSLLGPVVLSSFNIAIPTAELEPTTETYVQGDEVRNRPRAKVARLTRLSQGGYTYGYDDARRTLCPRSTP